MVAQNNKNNSKISKLLLTYIFMYVIICALSNLGIAQMVARYLGVVEAVGSNPATQTKKTGAFSRLFCYLSTAICHTKRGGRVEKHKTIDYRFMRMKPPKARRHASRVYRSAEWRLCDGGGCSGFKSCYSDQKDGRKLPSFLINCVLQVLKIIVLY